MNQNEIVALTLIIILGIYACLRLKKIRANLLIARIKWAEQEEKYKADRLANFLRMKEIEEKADREEAEITRREDIRENLLKKQQILKLRMSRQTF